MRCTLASQENKKVREELDKALVEAVLFAAPKGLSIDELCSKTRLNKKTCTKILKELQLERRKGGVHLAHEGGKWFFTVRSDLTPTVKDLAVREFPKSITETLAVIAYKAPVLQSEVIKIRGNKAYDHVKYLVNKGLVASKREGRTNLLKLTSAFYEYFNMNKKEVERELKKVKNAR